MALVIALFNHKGGVSKTTTAFNLGWMLAALGKTVILADFDPQCNLTGMILGYRGVEDLENLYTSDPANNVKDGLAPAFESKPREIAAVECQSIPMRPGLYLLPGHIGLAEYETTLGIAQELSGSLLALKNLPGSLRYLLDVTAEKYAADYVIVDMSPSLGPLNQNLLVTSDHFIVPLHPDYFSSMALTSLAKVLPRWKRWGDSAYSVEVLRDADYPFPRPVTTFIGAIIQKYRPRSGRASKAFQRWIDQLVTGLRETLTPALLSAKLVNEEAFKEKLALHPWDPIMEVADFNSLIAESQEHQVPVYALTAELLNQQGAVWEQTASSMAVFDEEFRRCAERVIAITSI